MAGPLNRHRDGRASGLGHLDKARQIKSRQIKSKRIKSSRAKFKRDGSAGLASR